MSYTKEQQAKHRAELVKALRSGDYLQGRKGLHIGNRFCCLGVACDLYSKADDANYPGDWRGSEEMKQFVVFEVFGEEYREDLILPWPVKDYYGFASIFGEFDYDPNYLAEFLDDPELITNYHFDSLTSVNDAGFSFEQIAKMIEAEFAGLLA